MSSIYEPLDAEQIRVVRLEPGNTDEPIRCHLIRIDHDSSVTYEALSYEWSGVPGHTHIYCANIEVRATRNLAEAMKALRLKYESRVLWIDAICINQNDNEERSAQVARMTEIYASASSVIVWLGPSFPGVEGSFKIFPFLARLIVDKDTSAIHDWYDSDSWLYERPKEGTLLRSKSTSCIEIPDNQDSYGSFISTIPPCKDLTDEEIFCFDNDDVWSAIDKLFGNSYFFRSWIAQEVGVAKDLVVWCGLNDIHWNTFQLAFSGRETLKFKPIYSQSNIDGVQQLRQMYQKALKRNDFDTKLELPSILSVLVHSAQTNPRDRVYAGRGLLMPQWRAIGLRPNYGDTVAKVFYDTMRYILDFYDLWVWRLGTQKSKRVWPDLPTWVPEFNFTNIRDYIVNPNVSFSRDFPRKFRVDGQSFFLSGFLVDEVSEVFEIAEEEDITSTLKMINSLRHWLKSRGGSLFGPYLSLNLVPNEYEIRLLSTGDEITSLLAAFEDIPGVIQEKLLRMREESLQRDTYEHGLTNLESMCLVLQSIRYNSSENTPRYGHHLLICLLLIEAWQEGGRELFDKVDLAPDPSRREKSKETYKIDEEAPQSWRDWLNVAMYLTDGLVAPTTRESYQMQALYRHTKSSQKYLQNDSGWANENFFVTKKGHFGRAAAADVKVGQFVAVVSGAYSPYLLDKRADHFELVTCAYLQGLMTASTMGGDFNYRDNVKTIELR